jgi:hypothetical protein
MCCLCITYTAFNAFWIRLCGLVPTVTCIRLSSVRRMFAKDWFMKTLPCLWRCQLFTVIWRITFAQRILRPNSRSRTGLPSIDSWWVGQPRCLKLSLQSGSRFQDTDCLNGLGWRSCIWPYLILISLRQTGCQAQLVTLCQAWLLHFWRIRIKFLSKKVKASC